MTVKYAYSMETLPERNTADLAAQLSGVSAKLVVFFASSSFDPHALAAAMQQQFPQVDTIGCTTAGELISGKMLKNSVVAMAFDADVLEDVVIGVAQELKTENQVSQVFADFERYTGQKMMDLDPTQYVGMVLVDGLSMAEEKLMDKIGDLTNVIFIGGSAAKDFKTKETYVFAEGKAYTNAAVLALLKPTAGFGVVKTQSFCDMKKVLRATRVNEAERLVIEFDGEPAREAYAKAIGVSIEEAAGKFAGQPLGVIVDEDIYVRSPRQFQDNALSFYCHIKEGMDLHLLQSTDIIRDTQAAFQAKKKEMGGVSGLINFHCVYRTIELEQQGRTEAYGKIFADVPMIGFSTYGEQYLGHINLTSVMLLFK